MLVIKQVRTHTANRMSKKDNWGAVVVAVAEEVVEEEEGDQEEVATVDHLKGQLLKE